MTQTLRPRTVTSVLVEEQPDKIVVTWGLGEPIPTPATPEFFGYGVDYYRPDGNGGKRLGVRFGDETTAYIFDWADTNQSNYDAESVHVDEDSIVITYRDAGLGVESIGRITAFSHVEGIDSQVELPVTVLR